MANSCRSITPRQSDLAPTLLEAAGLKKTAKMPGRSFLALLQGREWYPRQEVFVERNGHGKLDLIRAVRTRTHKLIYNLLPMRNVGPIKDLRQSPSWESIVEEFLVFLQIEEMDDDPIAFE